jgi:plastocyanin/6-phosphogluconolactonase (cycloisomerase 2 family)
MKWHIKLALVLGSAVLLPFFTANAATFQVQVGQGGQRFTPANITIAPGDTVEWVWAGNGHSTTSGTPGNPDGKWDSGVQNNGFTFSFTFSTAGSFPYYCSPHGQCCGMIGTVTVTSGSPKVGAIFVNANSTNNRVWMYNRGSDGGLTFVRSFNTGGNGSTNGLTSQGSITLTADHKYLYAVNAGSNDISGFVLRPNGLASLGKVPSGGTFPNSVATYGNLLYVLNARGSAANITGFTIQTNGTLVAIPNSTRPLSTALPTPAQIGFTPDGTTLIVTERGTTKIDTFSINPDGTSNGPVIQSAAGPGPFGFDFDAQGYLFVSEVTQSSASSYSVSGGVVTPITSKLRDLGKAACWAICTHDPSLPQQYGYVSNTNSDSISGYVIASDGRLSLVNADGRTAVLPRGAFLLDLVMSSDSKYLYVLEGKLPGIAAFAIQTDGNLTPLPGVTGTPTSSYGMAGY